MNTIILAGGSGTRLWPLSRKHYPKQFLKLSQFEDKSLFQLTVQRALVVNPDPKKLLVVANIDLKYIIMGQIEELEIEFPEENIIIEPEARNTMPAILLGLQNCSDEEALILSSDQIMKDTHAFLRAVQEAQTLVKESIVLFGVTPTHPETGYGYIKHKDGKVEEFKEKPDEETAKEYIKKGYLWNSGMFMINKNVLIHELEKTNTQLADHFRNSQLEEVYSELPKNSIDYAVIEKANQVNVIPLDAGWSDLGTFDSFYDEFDKDENGNVQCDDFLSKDSHNNLIMTTEKKVIAISDLNDHIVIDTPDALMICPRKTSQKVKKLVDGLKEEGDERTEFHTTVYRPWGFYKVLEVMPGHLVKRLHVYPGKILSLQHHNHRSEHWVVVKGVAFIVKGEEEFFLKKNESVSVPVGTKHRFGNKGTEPMEIIEVQSGEYLREDDIVRYEDEYGRK